MLLLPISCTQAFVGRKFNTNVQIKLKTVYLHDNRFPTFTDEQIARVLAEALGAMEDEFGVTNISLSKPASSDILNYFKRTPTGGRSNAQALPLFGEAKLSPLTEVQRSVLEDYTLDNLRKFLPQATRGTVRDYDSFYRIMFDSWVEKARRFSSVTINGKPLVTPETAHVQTSTGWREMLGRQTDFDLVFTNTAIFDDSLDRPFPHGVYSPRLAMGAFSEESPGAPSGTGYAVMVSPLPYMDPSLNPTALKPDDLPEVLGVYVVAHELGHSLFKIPDVYDHPLHCLMNTPPENLDYVEAIKRFRAHKGPCPKCARDLKKGKRDWMAWRDFLF